MADLITLLAQALNPGALFPDESPSGFTPPSLGDIDALRSPGIPGVMRGPPPGNDFAMTDADQGLEIGRGAEAGGTGAVIRRLAQAFSGARPDTFRDEAPPGFRPPLTESDIADAMGNARTARPGPLTGDLATTFGNLVRGGGTPPPTTTPPPTRLPPAGEVEVARGGSEPPPTSTGQTVLNVIRDALYGAGQGPGHPGSGLSAFMGGASRTIGGQRSEEDRALRNRLAGSADERAGRADVRAGRADARAERADTRAQATHELQVRRLAHQLARELGGQLTAAQIQAIETEVGRRLGRLRTGAVGALNTPEGLRMIEELRQDLRRQYASLAQPPRRDPGDAGVEGAVTPPATGGTGTTGAPGAGGARQWTPETRASALDNIRRQLAAYSGPQRTEALRQAIAGLQARGLTLTPQELQSLQGAQ